MEGRHTERERKWKRGTRNMTGKYRRVEQLWVKEKEEEARRERETEKGERKRRGNCKTQGKEDNEGEKGTRKIKKK